MIPSSATALPDTLAASVRGVPGVTAAVPVKHSFAYDSDGTMIRQRGAWYLDVSVRALRLPVTSGSLDGLTGDTVAVARSVADAHGWVVGAYARLWLGDGAPVRLRVVATLRDRLGLPAVVLRALRLAGAARAQVLRIAGREAVLAGLAGALLAGVVTAATLVAVVVALGPLVSEVPIVVPWPPLLAITGGCLLVAFLAARAGAWSAVMPDRRPDSWRARR